MKAKRITDLEVEATNLSMRLYVEFPSIYSDRSRDQDDPLSCAWNKAVDATLLASIALEDLGNQLRAKAQINTPGPCEELNRDEPEAPEDPQRLGADGDGTAP